MIKKNLSSFNVAKVTCLGFVLKCLLGVDSYVVSTSIPTVGFTFNKIICCIFSWQLLSLNMYLLNLCLTSMYFQYNGKHYKRLHGTAMGSPVSVVVAEIVMQNIEEQALATYTQTTSLVRYVDDTFTAVHKDGIDDFHEHLNRQNADIQFPEEIEENGKIPVLDCLVPRDYNKLTTTIYRKPTHTNGFLDQSSYNPTSHKATTSLRFT